MSTLELLRAALNSDSPLCSINVEHLKGSFYQISIEWPWMPECPTTDLRLPNHVFATRVVTIIGDERQFNRQDLSVVVNERHFREHYIAVQQ